jgi:hypothetical protein
MERWISPKIELVMASKEFLTALTVEQKESSHD